MTILRLLVCAACLALVACRGGTDDRKDREDTGSSPEAEASAGSDSRVVKIEPGMRRDLRITTARVERRPGAEQVSLLGELAVNQAAYAEVGVPVAARVTRLLAGGGDPVGPGQALAELTSVDLARARADYVSAAARVRLAEAALVRKRDLAAERIVPVREVQEAESQAADAEAALRSARAAIAAFGVEPPSGHGESSASPVFTLRAPIGGVVIERSAVVGQMLEPASPAFRIGDLSRLWLTVHAFERDAVRIEQGAPARLVFPALPGQEFPGTVAVVGREVDRESRTLPVRIDVRNSGALLRPGMSATAFVPVGASGEAVLAVPVAAVHRVREAWCVFLPRDAGTFEIRPIGRGRDLGTEVEVLSGLEGDEIVVVEGAFLLKAHAEKGSGGHDEH
jgi:cobalt-zinc-cadmium efflux system membrane fusion protein